MMDDMVAVLTSQGLVWTRGPARVSTAHPCVIDSTGVTLFRWLRRRPSFVPLERVDRFDVVLRDPTFDWDPVAGRSVERLALLTRDGQTLLVVGLRNSSGAPSLRSRAQQLNNHIVWRSADEAGDDVHAGGHDDDAEQVGDEGVQ